MDIFTTLEERVEQVIAAYRGLQARVAALEEENERLKTGSQERVAELEQQLAAMEAERGMLRERLEKLLRLLASVEL